MKIKIKNVTYDYAMAAKRPVHKRPKKPNILFRSLIRLLSIPELISVDFSLKKELSKYKNNGPYLILMNHSSFIDLKIAYGIFYPMPFCIVSTIDSYIGKNWLMHQIGCIPTQKYVSDIKLISDMNYAINEKNTSVLMFPEAGYSFDGRSTVLPKRLGILVKKLNVPVLSVITDGAFLRDPLYNGLQKRKTKVTAQLKCLISKNELYSMSVQDIDNIIDNEFSFDNFANQYNSQTKITENFRADGLNRILYRCPNCHAEGQTVGKGTTLTCTKCNKSYELNQYGRLESSDGNTEFPHIPDWYSWQRECVRKEIISGEYRLDTNVKIGLITDRKALYMVGNGRLVHDKNGFHLTGCDGKLEYSQAPNASFSLNADFYWYEIGDVICIGNKDCLYYCFPEDKDVVTKARLATEEMYKLNEKRK